MANEAINVALDRLIEENKLTNGDAVVLWGMGIQTSDLIEELAAKDIRVEVILDNFKDTFTKEYKGISVKRAKDYFDHTREELPVVLSINYADAVIRQLQALGVSKIYNLRDMDADYAVTKVEIPYKFVDRSKGKEALCYVLAGYEQAIWDGTLGRIERYQSDKFDYCLISSGKYDEQLEEMAERNGWSYLSTEKNQVCYIQNLVIELHPKAEYIIKMDEDIFIGENFFDRMLDDYKHVEQEGDYRIGFAVPVVPLNCASYVTYLKLSGNREEYERRFGRAYISRFSAVFNVVETAEYLWDTMESFDDMNERFSHNSSYGILNCYYNIGVIMYSRERWIMMGKWPVNPDASGMAEDEVCICQDGCEKDMAIYEFYDILAGHLAFGHQKARMLEYYKENRDKFL